MPIAYSDTEIYDTPMDEAVAQLPESIRRVYIDTRDAPEDPEKPAGEFNPTDVVYPTPDYINPPEREATPFRGPDTSKVLFKTKTGIEITERDIEDGMGLAGGFMGTMAGVKAKTMKGKMNDLGGAQTLEAQGKNVDEIFKETGMFRGADGRWRFEIDDSTAGFDKMWNEAPKGARPHTPVEKKLSDVLDHQDLYAAYPQLKDVKLRYDPMKEGAHADFANNEIVVGKEYAKNQGVLMHEVQHIVQEYEGFAKGGYPMKATTEYRLKFQKDFEALKPEMQELVNTYQKSVEGKGVITKKEVERLSFLATVSRKYQEYVKAADDQAAEYYLRLAGETEARNVDTRLSMNAKERAALHPKWTQDLDAMHQIISNEVLATTAYGLKDAKGHIKKPK